MSSKPNLSIIVPLYNEEKRLPVCMAKLITQIRLNLWQAEIILVPNGCTDKTFDLATRYQQQRPYLVRVLEIAGRGKGAAVRAGMLAARGEYRYMADCDLSTPVKEIANFMRALDDWQDVVIGSRALPAADVKTTLKRRLIGRAFHLLTGRLVPGVRDTQCGFKMFKGAAAEAIFARAKVDGWAFDVEALYLARRLGYRVKEIPVTWEHDPDSRVNLVTDSLQMLKDVLTIPLKQSLPA